jgi:hypothetical protein
MQSSRHAGGFFVIFNFNGAAALDVRKVGIEIHSNKHFKRWTFLIVLKY